MGSTGFAVAGISIAASLWGAVLVLRRDERRRAVGLILAAAALGVSLLVWGGAPTWLRWVSWGLLLSAVALAWRAVASSDD
jgi:hypothetical protein